MKTIIKKMLLEPIRIMAARDLLVGDYLHDLSLTRRKNKKSAGIVTGFVKRIWMPVKLRGGVVFVRIGGRKTALRLRGDSLLNVTRVPGADRLCD